MSEAKGLEHYSVNMMVEALNRHFQTGEDARAAFFKMLNTKMDPKLDMLFQKALNTEAEYDQLVRKVEDRFEALTPEQKKKRVGNLSDSYIVTIPDDVSMYVLVVSYEMNDVTSHITVMHYPSRVSGNGYGNFKRAIYDCMSKIVNPEVNTRSSDSAIFSMLMQLRNELQDIRRDIGLLRAREPTPAYKPPDSP
jgi:hypothetical protein